MSLKKMVFMVFIATVLSGCATTNCDPTQDGFIGGVGCTLSGGYDNRIEAREAELERSKQKQQQAAIEQQELDVKLQSLMVQFEEMSVDIDSLGTQLDQMQSENASVIDKVEQLNQRRNQVLNKLARLKQQQKVAGKAEAAKLEKQAKKLQQEVDDLWTIYHSLQ
ncbi:lipoprotein [Candidatus Thiomargarita nelsonii]|uniref:Lipoprotein n=1 Tax=Candidatus Thiomargarita nelsonii TaxID=1003181 RepID=A0A0A6P1I5_9GAMM|nr:lipoprotein [Candidatus Thiomargarita nelsonii]